MQSGRIENITIQNFGQSGSIGLWLNNVVTWAERSDIEIVANLNTNAVVFNNSSFDYSTYKFVLSANSNQNGVVIENGAQLYGTDMTIRGNFGTGTANTGTVLTIGTTSSDGSQLGASHLLCQVETNGTTGLGHTTITIGAAAAFSGNGILNFISGNGTSFQSGNAGNRVAFSGYINVDSSMGTMAYWQGLRSIGPSTTNPGYMSPTGDIFPSNIILQQLTAGAQTITFDPGTQASLAGQAMTIDLLLQQPASGDTTLTWPSSVQWTTGNPPVLSTTANAVDHIRLTTPDFVTYFGEQLNITYPGGIRTTTGAPVSASTDQVGEFAWDNSSHTIYGPLASPVPAVGQPWNSTAVRLALATAPSFAQTGTPVYGYSSPPSATLPSCTAGNTLVLWITKSTATATTVSGGPSGVTWTKAASAYDNTNGGACEIWLGTGYSTSSSTISPTITASGNFIGSVGLDESTGIPASSAVDTQYATLASGNIAQIITTDEPNDLVISVVNNMSGNTLSNPSLTNSWISDNLGMSWGLLASPTTVGTVTWTSQTGTDHTVMATLTLLSE
jgi:hypothetical protein